MNHSSPKQSKIWPKYKACSNVTSIKTILIAGYHQPTLHTRRLSSKIDISHTGTTIPKDYPFCWVKTLTHQADSQRWPEQISSTVKTMWSYTVLNWQAP